MGTIPGKSTSAMTVVEALMLVAILELAAAPCEGWESSDPDSFAWIEVLDQPFLYQMAEVAVDV